MTGTSIPRPSRSQAAILVAGIAVVAITAGLALQGKPSPSASPGPSGAPTATSDVAATASPGLDEPWTALTLPAIERAATLEPVSSDTTGISPSTEFTLKSLTGEPAAAMAARLEVSPAVALDVVVPIGNDADVSEAFVRPVTRLAPNRSYRFTLRTPDGSVAASWAFRVRGPVAVTSTIPGNAVGDVPVDTGIEVAFNQPGMADMADHFSISPAVTGRFERHGLTQVFVPDGPRPGHALHGHDPEGPRPDRDGPRPARRRRLPVRDRGPTSTEAGRCCQAARRSSRARPNRP